MSTPPEIVGYAAVVIPARDWYQGYYIPAYAEPVGRELLVLTRRQISGPRSAVRSTVLTPAPDLSAEDQQVSAALAAALVEIVTIDHPEGIATVLQAMRQHLKTDYFVVVGDRGRSGTNTAVTLLPVRSIDAARDAVHRLPEVQTIRHRNAAKGGKTDASRDR